MWKRMGEEGSRQLRGEGCRGGTVRTGTDGEGWSCSVYFLLLTPPAHAFGHAAWPAGSDGFSVPVLVRLGCGASAAPSPLPPCSHQGLPMRVRLPRLPRLNLHRSPAARLPRGAGNPSAHPAESKINERQMIGGRLSPSLLLAYGSARTWKHSFQVSLCIYVTQTNSFLERTTLSHLDT